MSALTMKRGDTLKFKTIVRIDDVVVDITGWKVWYTVKQSYAELDANATFRADTTDATGAVAITNGPAGEITVKMPPSATFGMADTDVTLYYDVQVKNLDDEVSTVDSGTIVVSPDVTRATT